jgi:clan AA aspartic protease
MITGHVTAGRMARIRLPVLSAAGQRHEVETLIDTGFDGALTLPPELITTLGLVWRRRGRALLADGSESIFDIYETTVVWDGQLRRVAVDAADTEPLVGMALLEGYELTVQVRSGGSVTIIQLP